MTADKLVKSFVKIRDRRAEIAEEDRQLKEQQEILSHALMDIFNDTGTESLRTAFGTATRRVNQKFWTNDWDAFFAFMKEKDVILVQKRIAVSNLEEYMADNPKEKIPGLMSEASYVINVRRK